MADLNPSQNRGGSSPTERYNALWDASDTDRILRSLHGHDDWRSDGEIVSEDEADRDAASMRNPMRNEALRDSVGFGDNFTVSRKTVSINDTGRDTVMPRDCAADARYRDTNSWRNSNKNHDTVPVSDVVIPRDNDTISVSRYRDTESPRVGDKTRDTDMRYQRASRDNENVRDTNRDRDSYYRDRGDRGLLRDLDSEQNSVKRTDEVMRRREAKRSGRDYDNLHASGDRRSWACEPDYDRRAGPAGNSEELGLQTGLDGDYHIGGSRKTNRKLKSVAHGLESDGYVTARDRDTARDSGE